jgi:hypothetical protein
MARCRESPAKRFEAALGHQPTGATEKQIDALVYELCRLTEEEMAIVKGAHR